MLKELLAVALFFFCFLWVLQYGLEKTERAECLQWQEYEKEFASFYWTDWQKEQCGQFGVYPQK